MSNLFSYVASASAQWIGRPLAFVFACALVIVWAAFGPMFDWSDTHQLVINTTTTIITFLILFLVQYTQNRDTRAINAKLDELLEVTEGARSDLERIEESTEEEIEAKRR